MVGALLGLGTQMYSNALRKLPYMRRILLFSFFFFNLRKYSFFLLGLASDFWFRLSRSMGTFVGYGTWYGGCQSDGEMGS